MISGTGPTLGTVISAYLTPSNPRTGMMSPCS